MLEAFVRHRREVVTRRTIFDLRKARERAHILEGLAVALANIDEVIALIKASPTPAEAKAALMARAGRRAPCPDARARGRRLDAAPTDFRRSSACSPAGYRLSDAGPGHPRHAPAPPDRPGAGQDRRRVPGAAGADPRPERHPRAPERLLAGDPRRAASTIRDKYGDKRAAPRSSSDDLDLTIEDLIEPQDVVVTLSHAGYAKAQPVTEYQAQRRGGAARRRPSVKDEDFIEKLFVANTHDTLLCFSNRGKLYWLKVYQLPQAAAARAASPS